MHIIHVGMFSLKKTNTVFKKEKMLFYFAPSTVVCNTDELFWCVCVCSQPLDSDPLPSDLLTAAALSPASWGGGGGIICTMATMTPLLLDTCVPCPGFKYGNVETFST